MATQSVQRPDSPESKSDASASGPGVARAGVPPSPDLAERITRRAYEIAERRGFSPGHELDDWLQAERELQTEAESEPELEAGQPRNTPPDNPFDQVRTFSNE